MSNDATQDQGSVGQVALAAGYARQIIVVNDSEVVRNDGKAGNTIRELILRGACHHLQDKDPAGALAAGFVYSQAISPGDMHASLVKDSASSLSAFINVPTGASL